MGKNLESLAVKRNFLERTSRISDSCLDVLATNCPNLKTLCIDYSRKFDLELAVNLSRMHNLEVLMLVHCPIIQELDPLIEGCPNLTEVNISGDSWVRADTLMSLAKHPGIKVLHMGHFEHSDCDCDSLLPQ